MHGDAAPSNRRQAAYHGLQLLESVCAEIREEEYVMDVLSRLSLLQHNMHLQLQRGNMRSNADSAGDWNRDATSRIQSAALHFYGGKNAIRIPLSDKKAQLAHHNR